MHMQSLTNRQASVNENLQMFSLSYLITNFTFVLLVIQMAEHQSPIRLANVPCDEYWEFNHSTTRG